MAPPSPERVEVPPSASSGGAPRPLRVGVVGAGPWSMLVHAPMFAAHPRATLAGVWARRNDAAAQVASTYDAPAFRPYDELLANCDAVSFAVPPDIQAELAITAANAGKALLLEKPLALDLDHARRLVDAVDETGVITQLMLTWRYSDAGRMFLDQVRQSQPIGGRAWFISGAFLDGPFATPWRLEHGPLLDLGPHVIDLLDATLGTVATIQAHGQRHGWIGLWLEHENGLVSEASLCASSDLKPIRAGIEIYSRDGATDMNADSAFQTSTFERVVDEFVAAVERQVPHVVGAHRGLHLQRLLDAATQSLKR